MNEYIVRLAWEDSYTVALVEADSPEHAARMVKSEEAAPVGARASVVPFVPSRTIESDGTVTIRNANS